jgi:predicted transcriptional regulator
MLMKSKFKGFWAQRTRARLHMSQTILARMIGCSQSSISEYETGHLQVPLRYEEALLAIEYKHLLLQYGRRDPVDVCPESEGRILRR